MNAPKAVPEPVTLPPNEQMHRAVANRDASYDGRFYYGVITTGVVCRPSCAARRANPENLRFFQTLPEALAAGFRTCKRCHPHDQDREVARMARVARHIEEHADEPLTLASLARGTGLSPARLQKAFKAVFGVSPKAYQSAARTASFKRALKEGDDVTGAIFAAGYGSTSRVYGNPAHSMGMTPAAYRAGGEGERIFHACRNSALGPLMMAATDRGVCFAQFGDGPEELLARLQREFPRAELVGSPSHDAPELDAWIDALDRHLRDNAPRPGLPLDLRGTSFQVAVWRFLLRIREGEVVSYGEVAQQIGKPKAVRAVASACAANRIGVLVPCHRVLRGDGSMGGYRWGVDRKRTLLDIERRSRDSAHG